jgi:hypothetical protein
MRLRFAIELDDSSVTEIEQDARDIRAWEAEYGESWLNTPLSYTQTAQIAYLAAVRLGVYGDRFQSYKDFDQHAVEVRGVPNPALVGNPTHEGATAGPSSTSRSGSAVSRPRSKAKGRTS